ncbi:hypothetical protein [Bdellovibrio sp.]|uniref:hypothetical protein n=1 Tax=Bdellovibrio sp. TaxID=28201 RepID=UPI0039E67AA1
MKTMIFAFMTFFSAISFAEERVFDCAATSLTRSLEVPEGANLQQNPQVIFRQGLKHWSLQVGDLYLNTRDPQGPALWMKSGSVSKTKVEYVFWVEASTEYELVVSVVDYSAQLFWWGLGEKVLLGNFQCEVTEQ